ncbi:MAG TPA: HAMP domain-containing protein, partial [Vicinamibacterales bacterium]|nr:HAMP domain-containing protein [Vicinamibacterales bacterium]
MRLLPGGSIRGKLAALLMIASSVVLIAASVAYVAWDYFRFRADMRTSLEAQAELVLDNTAAALTFQDVDTAREGLEMLSINPHVLHACLYKPDRTLFTEVRFDHGKLPEAPCPADLVVGTRFTTDRLEVTEQLTRGRSTGGMLFIVSDLDLLTERLQTQSAAMLAIVFLGLLLSFLLSFLLQRVVARPISSLAATAREIADRGDYSIRATRTSDDEIGVLVGAFNRMLDEIESSQRERADLLEREQEANRLKD